MILGHVYLVLLLWSMIEEDQHGFLVHQWIWNKTPIEQ